MSPDFLNLVGVLSLVFLALVCIRLTFVAWRDGVIGDFASMKCHLRIIGFAQLAILGTAISIGTDIVASCYVGEPKESFTETTVQQPQYLSRASVNH